MAPSGLYARLCHAFSSYKLFLNYSRLNVRKHFFSERIAAIWNNLECNIVDFTNISAYCLVI